MKKFVSRFVPLLILCSLIVSLPKINIVKASGTIYIRADGTVDGTDKIQRDGNVYTFTGNINGSIFVERDNIVVNGAGYTLQGTGSGTGIELIERSKATIKNMGVKAFSKGIWLDIHSDNNIVSGNTLINNDRGICICGNSDNNIVSGNNVTNNDYGIWLYSSSNNRLRNNHMNNNKYNFWVEYAPHLLSSDFVNDIDASNTVNGKPVYYWVNKRDKTVPSDARYVALVYCTGITVQNLNLTNNGQGILLASTTNSTITKNNIKNNHYGIELRECTNNNIVGNNIASNVDGIYFSGPTPFGCSNNIIYHNSFINNKKQVNDIHWEIPFSAASINIWDNGKEGNYWSDYEAKYPNATELDGSGIWDTPYVIDGGNQDNHPLMNPWIPPTQQSEPFPTWIVAAIAIIAVVGAALLVYFAKVRKTTGKAEK